MPAQLHDIEECGGELRSVRIGDMGSEAFLDDAVAQKRWIHSSKRGLAGKQFVHDDSESVHVCLCVGCDAFQELGGGIMQRVLQRGCAICF